MSAEEGFVRPPPYADIVHRRIHDILGQWEPHVLTQDEINDIRTECNSRRRNLLDFHRWAHRVHPQLRNEFERRFWITELEYNIRYFRLFRVNDLPPEILSNILRYVVWSAPDPPTGALWRLEVTWVCRHWRQVAINDTTLWNAIWFRDFPPFERSLTFVQRSRHAPVDIRINDHHDREFTYEEIENLLDRLTPHLSNIRILIVLFHDWECILSLMRWLDHWSARVPLIMDRLEIHRTGSPYHWPGPNWMPTNHKVTLYPLFAGKRIPSLTHVTLNALHCDWNNTTFENLTTLDIRRIPLELCPTVDRFREMLANCPKLDKLSIDGAGPGDRHNLDHGQDPILFKSLRILVLANFNITYLRSIITHIAAPRLRDLTLMNFFVDDYGPFFTYITNRFPDVRLLTLYSVDMKPEGIDATIDCLDSFPHLTFLRLANLAKEKMGLFLYDVVTKEPHPDLGEELTTFFGLRRSNEPQDQSATATPAIADPTISTPAIAAPDISTPAIAAPDIFTPAIAAPVISTPAIAAPDISTPAIAAPDIFTPVIAAPAIFPAIAAPAISPTIAAPAISPIIAAPAIATSVIATSSIATPAIATPAASTPAASTSATSTLTPSTDFTTPRTTANATTSTSASTSAVIDSDTDSYCPSQASSRSSSRSSSISPSFPPRVLSPLANVIEVERTDPTFFTAWVEARKKIGVPVVKAYITHELFSRLKSGNLMERCEAAIERINVTSLGAKTQEEAELLKWDGELKQKRK
ncbi:hypothetical protein K435DRAFT_788433 [Dendrothele bispora CBS 962.96]|uniref:F-box domain-containing protein n=1 Tax=Dendrothele bispora (strain CBS 962.96) TaxID=1314807 RepID=A0A4V4HIR8_DENBC|nr:hypothetical protein K435DRAFT_788433 [Dendrothele bispora CBS 962.96]